MFRKTKAYSTTLSLKTCFISFVACLLPEYTKFIYNSLTISQFYRCLFGVEKDSVSSLLGLWINKLIFVFCSILLRLLSSQGPSREVPQRMAFSVRLKRGIHPFSFRGGIVFTFRVSSSYPEP